MSGRRAVGGAAWTVGGYAAVQGLRFGFNLVLAGLVAPKVFGVMALVNLLVMGLQMFSDVGVRQCVVRHPRGDDPAFLHTAWTVQVARGTVLWAASVALAWPVAAFYGEPALLWLVPLAGAGAFIVGWTSPAVFTLSRRIDRGPLVRREVGVYVLQIAAILLGLRLARGLGPDAQFGAIAVAGVLAAAAEVAASYTLPAAGRPRFRWEPAARAELLHFGGWVFVSTACTFLAMQADRLVVGRLSLELLGVYHIAAVIAAVPPTLTAALAAQLVFPLVGEAVRRGDPLGPVFAQARRALVLPGGLLVLGAGCVGPAVVDLAYDDRYRQAAGFVRLLALSAWFSVLAAPAEALLLATGRPRCLAAGQGARVAALPATMLAGYAVAGVSGLVVGAAAAEAVRFLVLARFARRAGVRTVGRDAGLTVLAGVVAAAAVLADQAAGERSAGVRVLAGTAVVTAGWAGVCLLAEGRPAAGRLKRIAGRPQPVAPEVAS